jgi:hypothetical protein
VIEKIRANKDPHFGFNAATAFYSSRNATIGSTRTARRAGK